jgi:hypothetical protein
MLETIQQIKTEGDRLHDMALALEQGADRVQVAKSLSVLSGRLLTLAVELAGRPKPAGPGRQINAAGGTVVLVDGDQVGTINMGGA